MSQTTQSISYSGDVERNEGLEPTNLKKVDPSEKPSDPTGSSITEKKPDIEYPPLRTVIVVMLGLYISMFLVALVRLPK